MASAWQTVACPVGPGPRLGMAGRCLFPGSFPFTTPCRAHYASGLEEPTFLRMLRPTPWVKFTVVLSVSREVDEEIETFLVLCLSPRENMVLS